MASSTVIAINVDRERVALAPPDSSKSQKKKLDRFYCQTIASILNQKPTNGHDMRKLIHSVKVGVALVLVSLLYLLGPLYKRVGENAMWAIMTVVVIFEFFAGATLSKGLNRGIGTVLGGGLGCLGAAFAQAVGGVGKAIVVGIAVFIFGAGATYTRQIPNIKKKYDYGALIFILTFNLALLRDSGLKHVLLEKKIKLFGDPGYRNNDYIRAVMRNPYEDPLISFANSIISRHRAVVENVFGHLKNYQSCMMRNRHSVPIHMAMLRISFELVAKTILDSPLRSDEFFSQI